MPFKSESQRKALWANAPDVARKWTKKYGSKPVSKGSLERRLKKGKHGRRS